jgi:hypothetical protein
MGKPAGIKMVMNPRTMATTDQTDKLRLKLSLPVNAPVSWPILSTVSVLSRREARHAAVSPKSDQVFCSGGDSGGVLTFPAPAEHTYRDEA